MDIAWFASLRRRYYPAAATASEAREVAHQLTEHGRFNLGPRAVRGGADGDSSLTFCFFEASEDGIRFVLNEPGAARPARRAPAR